MRVSEEELQDIAEQYMEAHKKAFEEWNEGNIEEVWLDGDQRVCIRYESGKWWHYGRNGQRIVWW